MVRDAIVILTSPFDQTAAVVLRALEELQEPVVLLDTSTYPAETVLTISYGTDLPSTLVTPTTSSSAGPLELSSVRSVWNRRPLAFGFHAGLSKDTIRFANAEAQAALVGALLSSDCFWINHPQVQAQANLKPYQLRVAADVGLAVPKTVVTNSADHARWFLAQRDNRLVYKRLSSASLYDDAGRLTSGFTALITDEHYRKLAQVPVTPCMFQEVVPKAYELRVTIVGDWLVAAQINSQDAPGAPVDWRLVGDDMPWTPAQLPDAIAERLRKLMRRLGLVFGAVDLIVTPSGDYVFLEVNPAGQWAWFDDEITIPIRDEIVRLLTAPPGRPRDHGEAPFGLRNETAAESSHAAGA